ncbi:MAG TPA: histidinol-phosphate transaminase [Gemmatimonadaceae bacterium]|jgi:histidinol-phosphate aminotransferase
MPRNEVRNAVAVEHGGRLAFANEQAHDGASLIDFSVCLNAHGPAPSVVEAIRTAPIDEYPDPHAIRARSTIAERWTVDIGTVMLGAGSAELIQAVCFAYLRPGDVALIVQPAFGEYARAASLCGARVVGVALSAGDDVFADIKSVIDARRPRLVFVASPVNPTGIAFEREALRSLANSCADVEALLVLDQAYDAFADQPLGTPALAGHPNVLHLRSLTKEHAIAGVRVAVGVGPTDVVGSIERVRVPWATSCASQSAAVAAFDDRAREHAQLAVAQLRAERQRIADAVTSCGVSVCATQTHYVLVACSDATALRNRLAAHHGILVRDCTSFRLPQHIRVAARLQPDNDLLIDALRKTLS